MACAAAIAFGGCGSSKKTASSTTSFPTLGTQSSVAAGGFCADLNRLINQIGFQTAESLVDKPGETAGQRQSDMAGWLRDYQQLIAEGPAEIKAALQSVSAATQGEDDALRAANYAFSTSDAALEAAFARFDAPDVRGAQQQIAAYAQAHCVPTP